MTKISELPEANSLSDDDWLTAVDVSNTTNNPTGENVKIQKSNLGVGGGGDGGLTLLEQIIIDVGTPGFFDFSGISQTFDHLFLEGIVRSTESGSGGQWANCWFNGVTGADNDYHFQGAGASNGLDFISEGPGARCWHVTTAGEQANQWAQVEMVIKNYARTDVVKSFTSTTGARLAGAWADNSSVVCFHDTLTAAITQLTIQDFDNPVFLLYGELRLYGVTR
jgi:hypothetical protein